MQVRREISKVEYLKYGLVLTMHNPTVCTEDSKEELLVPSLTFGIDLNFGLNQTD